VYPCFLSVSGFFFFFTNYDLNEYKRNITVSQFDLNCFLIHCFQKTLAQFSMNFYRRPYNILTFGASFKNDFGLKIC